MIVGLAPLTGSGQGAPVKTKVEVDRISFDVLPSPELNSSRNKSFKPKDWLEIEAKVRVQAAPAPPSGFIDKMTVKWSVAVENTATGARGTAILIKEITYVNVPVDQDFFVSVYLSPSSVRRISGEDRASERAVKGVLLEVTTDGAVAPGVSHTGPDKWWESKALGQMTGVPLLNKNETPFKAFWWDRYGEIEERQ